MTNTQKPEPDLTVIRRLEGIRQNQETMIIVGVQNAAELSPAVIRDYATQAHLDREFLLDLVERLQGAVADLVIQRERHELANGGCVPKPAYDEIAEAYAELKFRMDGLEK